MFCLLQACTPRKRTMHTAEELSEEEVESKKERTKRGKFVAVKEENKDPSEVVVEVRVHKMLQRKVFVSCLQSCRQTSNLTSLCL